MRPVAILLFLLAFRNLKEVVPQEEKKSQPILGTFGALKGNWPWLIIFSSSLLFWIAFISRVSAVPYFFEYNLHRKDLISLAYSLDFISLATAFLLPWFCKWTSKTAAWGWGLADMVAGQLILYFGVASGNSVPLIMTGWIIGFLGSGMAMAVPFSVLSDSVDYGEWKTGVRAAGLLDRRRRGVLFESRRRSGRRDSAVDHGQMRLCAECRTNGNLAERHRIQFRLAAGDLLGVEHDSSSVLQTI